MATGHTVLNFRDMTALSRRIVNYAILGNHIIGHVGSIYMYPTSLFCSDTCVYSVNIGSVYTSRGRWTRLRNMYLDPAQLELFKSRLANMSRRNPKTVSLKFNEVTNAAGRDHPWGGCLLSLSYRNEPASLILHSRTTRIGYTSFLDLAMAYVIFTKAIRPIIELKPSQVRFLWLVDLPQLSCVYTLMYLARDPRWKAWLRETHNSQVWRDLNRNHRRIKKGNSKWGPAKRIYKVLTSKTTRHIPVDSLELE